MKITKTKLKQIIAEEIAKLQEKNKPSDIEANLRNFAAAQAAAKKKNNEACGGLHEQEDTDQLKKAAAEWDALPEPLRNLAKPFQLQIEQSLNNFSDELASDDDDEAAKVEAVIILKKLLAKLTWAVHQGHVGPPA